RHDEKGRSIRAGGAGRATARALCLRGAAPKARRRGGVGDDGAGRGGAGRARSWGRRGRHFGRGAGQGRRSRPAPGGPPPRVAADTGGRAKLEGPANVSVDSAAAPAPVMAAPAPAPIVWDMEVQEHAERARVGYFVDVFSGRSKENFERALSRQTRYSSLISD